MRYEKNNGSSEDQIVQNRFTAYLKVSVNHHRSRYIKCKYQQQQQEIPLEDPDTLSADTIILPDAQLYAVVSHLRDQAQTIVLEHILADKPLVQLAQELDMPYPTVKAIYRRALEKLRKELRDEFH